MKKLIITAAILMLCTFTYGQLGLGIKAGLNLSGQTIKDTDIDISTKMKPGFHAGAYINYFIKKSSWGIQVEALYSMKGSEITFKALSGEENAKSKLYYIDVPILLRWQIIKLLNVHAGPQFNILLSAENEFDDVTKDVKDQLKTAEFAFAFGAGVNLPFRLNVTARYIIGVSNIWDGSEDINASYKNNLLMLSLGFRIFGK